MENNDWTFDFVRPRRNKRRELAEALLGAAAIVFAAGAVALVTYGMGLLALTTQGGALW